MDKLTQKIKVSFAAVAHDIGTLKETIVDWMTTLVSNQKKLLEKVKELEERISQLERKQ